MTKRTTRSVKQASTSAPFPTMSVSEFMRGGLHSLKQPTTIMSHSEVKGTWYPEGQGMSAVYYSGNISSTPAPDANAAMGSTFTSSPLRGFTPTPPDKVDALTEAVEKMLTYLKEGK